MLHVGLDLSRTRLDVHAMNEAGTPVLVTTAAPDAGGLASLVARVGEFGQPVAAAIESMTGARFVHDQLELRGWEVQVADAVKVKGLAPLAAKTDKIDAWVLAELSRRDLVPAIWLPDPAVRGERERARWRLHLVRHRTALKNRIHATLMAFGHPCAVSDLFGAAGRRLLADLELPRAVGRGRGRGAAADRRPGRADRRLRGGATHAGRRARLLLQRQLWRCLAAGPVVGGAGLGLASSAPPRPVRDVVQVGPRRADEGVEQPPEFGHGQRDELAGSGCGAPFSAVARVAAR